MADGFLDRWSQRKQAVREGKVPDEPPATPVTPVAGALPALVPAQAASTDAPQTAPASPAPAPPPPSLDDVQRLTPESDFAPFVARDVAPEVRNAAMKKLFADPHYQVMDGLDTYIDDYAKPDPLPESMLRQMASAKFLKLFEEEGEDEHKVGTGLGDDADSPPAESMAESAQAPQTGAVPLTENLSQEPGPDHDHTDLRLQPNHAAGPPEPGRSAE
ncbi:DUF3306 domain-containing protein [Rhodoferax ferrireducens]|uniref:DUF3306 domain-containing protein n=1 Tax=Rhodoferax ferrireducens TaxID=192843 RepID=UPI000E0DBF19|nr:DUF3306 domain-containing protein [Rhodoferax ferrireducens]